ncbi:TonB-dependent receptor domain-containing protein [Nitratireductor basaltis]|uniref:TonB-dependent receptor n=1 Tax=Nitratireductor basaltis TaxID=472175 RepID=A0A084UE23_9HYPH|nr:TonB-dependent receptor [Nitratireductor basaltis]KFB11209.1 TonB-dependent receptor [Nitratireductor basaltis]
MRKIFWLLAAQTSFISISAYAQDAGTTQLNRIVIEAPTEASVAVGEEDLQRINPEDVQDLFASEPSISVGSSLPISQKIYVQGVEENNLAVSIDGSRQNNKIFHHNATTLIDPALLKAVSIEPGVAPADAGPGALAGSMAFETMDARDLLAEGRVIGGFLKSEFDSNGSVFTNSGAAYGVSQGFEWLGFLKYADGDLREDGDGVDILGSETGLLSGLGKVAYEAPSGDRFELSYEHVVDDNVRPYRANIGQITAGRPVPLTRNYDLARSNVVFTYTDETPEGWWDPKFQIGYSMTDLVVAEDDSFSDASTGSFNGRLENRFAVDNGSITAGFDFYHDIADYSYSGTATWPGYDVTENATNIGAYTQASLSLTDRLDVSLGGRTDFQAFEGVDGATHDNAGVSGNISADYALTDFLTASAGASHVWAGIPLAENFITNPDWVYDDALQPVTADNVFAGLRLEHSGFWAEGKIFRTEIDNARIASWSSATASHDLVSQGYELTAGYGWDSGFVSLGFADIHTEIDGSPAESYTGNYLTMPLGRKITLEAAHTFVDWGLTLGADAQFVLEYDDTAGDPAPVLPSYEVVNVFAEYVPEFAPNLSVRGEVNNLFNETYASRATYGQEYETVKPLLEPGRSFKLAITGRF